MYGSIPPNRLLACLPPSFQSDGGMLGMKDVDKNQVGMAQNVESDTSIPHDIQSFWWWLRTMTFQTAKHQSSRFEPEHVWTQSMQNWFYFAIMSCQQMELST